MAIGNGIASVAEALRLHHRFLITGHIDPDPDAIGSAVALGRLLRRLGKEAVVAFSDPVPAAFRFLPGTDDIVTPDDLRDPFDALVVVDCPPDRIGKVGPWQERVGIVINIDHHLSNPGGDPLSWVDPDAAATGEMVYRLYGAMGVPVDREAATLLYAAVMTDTGSFRYSNTTAAAFHMAAALTEAGADPHAIAHRLYGQRPWSYLQLLMRTLPTLERSPDGRIVWMKVTLRMMEEAGAGPDELDGLVQYPRMVEGALVALLFRELPGGDTRVSFRSQDPVDVSVLAAELGGGGHARAAGCFVKAPLEEAVRTVLARTRDYLALLSSTPPTGVR